MTAWQGISPWWALLPVVLLVLWGLAKANYELFSELGQEQERIENELVALNRRLDQRAERKRIRDKLTQFWREAEETLVASYDAEGEPPPARTVSDWESRVKACLSELDISYGLRFRDESVPITKRPKGGLADQDVAQWKQLQARIYWLREFIEDFSDRGGAP